MSLLQNGMNNKGRTKSTLESAESP